MSSTLFKHNEQFQKRNTKFVLNQKHLETNAVWPKKSKLKEDVDTDGPHSDILTGDRRKGQATPGAVQKP